MAGILQSGQVTPFHGVQWLADGVVGDGGPGPVGQRVIASLRGANFNTTNDQPLVIPQQFVAFSLRFITITNASASLTTAAGGFYPAASKAGTPIVSSAQAYSALTDNNQLMLPTLAAFGSGTRFSARNLGSIGGLLTIWFSLTTPQGVAATADIYLSALDLT